MGYPSPYYVVYIKRLESWLRSVNTLPPAHTNRRLARLINRGLETRTDETPLCLERDQFRNQQEPRYLATLVALTRTPLWRRRVKAQL